MVGILSTARPLGLLVAIACATTVFAANSSGENNRLPARQAAEGLNDVGLMRMKEGDLSGAIMKFEEALAVDSSCVAARHNLGKVLAATKQYGRAILILERGLESSPDDKGCIVQLVQIYALKGDRNAWLRYIKKAAALPERFVLRELPILLLRQGSVEAAKDAAIIAIEADDRNPVCWFNKGRVSETEKNYAAAEREYSKALAIKPDYLAALVNLGNALDVQGKSKEAMDAYRKAYACDATDSFAQYNYGRMLVLSGEDVAKGFHLLKMAAADKGGASVPARRLLGRLVALTKEGGGK